MTGQQAMTKRPETTTELIDELHSRMDGLFNRIDAVEDRLEPFLVPRVEEAKIGAPDQPSRPMSQVNTRLENAIARVVEMSGRIAILCDRLEV